MSDTLLLFYHEQFRSMPEIKTAYTKGYLKSNM